MYRVYARTWLYLTLLAALLVGVFAITANTLAASADDVDRPDQERPDRQVDKRTGEKLGARQILVYDAFGQGRGKQLDGRDPVISLRGSQWEVELGDWQIQRGYLLEKSPEPWFAAGDKRAVIDAARTDVQVASRIQHDGGEQFVGVAARYSGAVDWLMFWYDGHGTLVLGAKKTDSGSDFHDLQRVPFVWSAGEKHLLTLAVRDQNIRAYVDRDLVMELDDVPVVGDATYAGVFARGAGETQFENFRVTGLERVNKAQTVLEKLAEKLKEGKDR